MAFGATVKSPLRDAERISRSIGVYAGQVSISSYATTLVELTGITKYFKDIGHTNATAALFPHGIISVAVDGISDLGWEFRWDATTGGFRVFYPTSVTAWNIEIPVDSGAPGETFTFDSGGGASALHADSAIGNITLAVTAREDAGSEANANDDVGTVNFIAIGLI